MIIFKSFIFLSILIYYFLFIKSLFNIFQFLIFLTFYKQIYSNLKYINLFNLNKGNEKLPEIIISNYFFYYIEIFIFFLKNRGVYIKQI